MKRLNLFLSLLTIIIFAGADSVVGQSDIAGQCLAEASKFNFNTADAAIKKCTAALDVVKTNEDKALVYFSRGVARYSKIRNAKSFTDKDAFSVTLGNAAKIGVDQSYKAFDDFHVAFGLDSSNETLIMGLFFAGEMSALADAAQKTDAKNEYLLKDYYFGAFIYWELAQKLGVDKKMIDDDRAAFYSVLKEKPPEGFEAETNFTSDELAYLMMGCATETSDAPFAGNTLNISPWCDAGILVAGDIASVAAPFRYARGRGRYRLIRQTSSKPASSFSQTLAVAAKFPESEIAGALGDYVRALPYLPKASYPDSATEGRIASGELYALAAVVKKDANFRQKALDEWNTAEQNGANKSTLDADRTALDAAFKNNAATAELADVRLQKIGAEFAPLLAAYEKDAQNLKTVYDAQTAAAQPDKKAVCQALKTASISLEKLNVPFAKIVAMRDAGELNDNAAALKDIGAYQAQFAAVKANLNAGLQKFFCQQ